MTTRNFRGMGVRSSRRLVAGLAVMGLLAVASLALAANRYAVVGLENATNVTIRAHHKWGDGQWSMDVIQPGARKLFWWTYAHANDNQSPRFHVRFDSDLQPGRIFNIDYDLKKNAAPAYEWADAHKYAFMYDGNRRYIDLYDKQ